MFGLEDKHVVISGAGGGIGRSLVSAFLAAGARVTACDRDASLLEALDGVVKFVFELTDAEETARAVATIVSEQGTPDVLVSNAGYTRAETMDAVDQQSWNQEVDINLTGSFNLIDPTLKAMIANGGGSIVMTSTVNALAHYGNPAYAAAKAGLVAYMRSIAVENGRDNIRANCICPGSVRTPAWDHRMEKDPSLLTKVVQHYPLGRLTTPADVANAAVFLASPLAGAITGVALPVDAGLTAGNLRFIRDVF
ncbi:SDR family oxidoreductase [Kaistia sp. UC242_56]|jgi:NAD(P)-dependent dehydrogenase (short-subunit alcohol dehydrogenase family)|uniref:SDR family oxidoreductase n=1 Tax=Kaistia sp. UC242_56 TaxID=3374625 RepID=UPI003386FC6F|nr:SDR family oxidoreductase [Kaistia sp.]